MLSGLTCARSSRPVWLIAVASREAKFMPEKPALRIGVKSHSTQVPREAAFIRDDVNGEGTAAANWRTSQPSSALVSYISEGPEVPGLSKLSTTPTRFFHSGSVTKACA